MSWYRHPAAQRCCFLVTSLHRGEQYVCPRSQLTQTKNRTPQPIPLQNLILDISTVAGSFRHLMCRDLDAPSARMMMLLSQPAAGQIPSDSRGCGQGRGISESGGAAWPSGTDRIRHRGLFGGAGVGALVGAGSFSRTMPPLPPPPIPSEEQLVIANPILFPLSLEEPQQSCRLRL